MILVTYGRIICMATRRTHCMQGFFNFGTCPKMMKVLLLLVFFFQKD